MIYLFLIIILNFGFAGFFDSDKEVYQTFDIIEGDVLEQKQLDDH